MNARVALPGLLLVSLVAGCTHAAHFEREGSRAAIGPGPEIRPPAAIALLVSTSLDIRFRRELEHSAEIDGSLVVVKTPAEADYVLRMDLAREATASPFNFLICWPGFLVFAPAWHGLDWPYSLRSRIAIERYDGGRVDDYGLEARWTAHHTPPRYGMPAGFAWCLLVYTVPALQAGIASSVQQPDTHELDRTFAKQEGELWADEVISTIVTRIARDRRTHPPRPIE